MALALLDQRIEVDRDLAQIVSACTTCGMCDVACKFIMAAERQDVILALKEHIYAAGFGAASLVEHEPSGERWADGLNLKTLPASPADVLVIVGFGALYDPRHAATAARIGASAGKLARMGSSSA